MYVQFRHRFSGGGVRTPTNYIFFDLIVSYLIILTTKFVKLPILSQISPCRPRKQILLNFFLGLSGRCHQAPAKASSSTPPPPPRYLSTPPNENIKICLWFSFQRCGLVLCFATQKGECVIVE